MKKNSRRISRRVPDLSPSEVDALPECARGNHNGDLVRCAKCGCVTFSVVARGLCRRHYLFMRSMVVSGRATWACLERSGLVLPSGKRGAHRHVDDFINRAESLLSESVVSVHGNPLAGVELSQLGS